MSERRQGRMAEEIQRFLSMLIPREVRDPRLGFLTITRVIVSGDLQHAAIYISVLGGEQEERRTLRILEQVKGYLRREVGHRLGVRLAPQLNFKLDQSMEEGTRVLEIMRELEETANESG